MNNHTPTSYNNALRSIRGCYYSLIVLYLATRSKENGEEESYNKMRIHDCLLHVCSSKVGSRRWTFLLYQNARAYSMIGSIDPFAAALLSVCR